ncbi:hypothetical protein [Streptomyces sp. NPDC127098]|uniref:hypothetical protein n=1 Tax=Streptomyces sp. NPDC127098 TaxID=3347137 RepID=UPI003658838D
MGRVVTHADAGLPQPENANAYTGSNTVESLVELARSDMNPSRRGVLGAAAYSAALAIPAWHDVVGRWEAVGSGRSQRIGFSDVETVTSMTEYLAELDARVGSRDTRPMAASFLVNTVAPYLRADGSNEVRRAMLSAASFACYNTGWMAVDEGLHGLAQRYYLKALELAGAAEDHLTYCHILRGMSVQAVNLGHRTQALRLASAARTAPAAGQRLSAFFAGQQAHCHAAAQERNRAFQALQATERAVDRASSQVGTFGGFSAATLAYATSQVQYELGDVRGSVRLPRTAFPAP